VTPSPKELKRLVIGDLKVTLSDLNFALSDLNTLNVTVTALFVQFWQQ